MMFRLCFAVVIYYIFTSHIHSASVEILDILSYSVPRSDGSGSTLKLDQSRDVYIVWFCFCFLSFSSHWVFFSQSYGDVTIAGEGLQILTHPRHSWPLSRDGSWACYTYCVSSQPFIMVISKDPWHSHLLPSVWQLSYYYLFLLLRSVAAGIRTPNLPLARLTL